LRVLHQRRAFGVRSAMDRWHRRTSDQVPLPGQAGGSQACGLLQH
jgi:hypothetical protein